MKRSLVLLAAVLLLSVSSYAQQPPRSYRYFFNIQTGGLLNGNNINFTASTTHGLVISDNFRIGAGIGYSDFGNLRGMPLFGIVSYDVVQLKNKNAFFVGLNYGWSDLTYKNEPSYYAYTESISGGRMANPHIGYRLGLNNITMGFSFGLVSQSSRKTYAYRTDVLDPMFSPLPKNTTDNLDRVMFMVSLGWK